MKIRKANKKDISRIYEIEKESFSHPWSINSLIFQVCEDALSDVYVILEDDFILGYLGIMNIFDEIHITNIAIDKEYRKKNYSTKLMQYLIEDADKNNKKVTLEVDTENEAALKLYDKFGFEIVGKRKDYYGKEKDAYIMWR